MGAGGMCVDTAAKMPAMPQFTDGWQLGEAGLVLEMPESFAVPARRAGRLSQLRAADRAASDKWVRAVEFRPGTRRVVHHALFQYIRGGSALSW